MTTVVRAWCLIAAIAGCAAASEPPQGRIVVAITVDWEGAYVSADGLAKLDELRTRLGDAPMTHFVSAGYFTKTSKDPELARFLTERSRRGDEIGMHLHAWSSLARASGITPKPAPSFLTGTDKLVEVPDGETGFDTDLDTYDVPALRAMLKTSRQRLESAGLHVSPAFRAGGYITSPRVWTTLREQGYTIDSSAIDFRELTGAGYLTTRVREVWPDIVATTQPFLADGILEIPIAAVADYTTAARLTEIVDAASARLRETPGRDIFITIALHQETAAEFAPMVSDALVAALSHVGAHTIWFVTIEKAAYLAREAGARRS